MASLATVFYTLLKKGNSISIPGKTKHIRLGMLNYYDLIISKIFRGTVIDEDDCIALLKAKNREIDYTRLKRRYKETYKVSPKLLAWETLLEQLQRFLKRAREEGVPGLEKIIKETVDELT